MLTVTLISLRPILFPRATHMRPPAFFGHERLWRVEYFSGIMLKAVGF